MADNIFTQLAGGLKKAADGNKMIFDGLGASNPQIAAMTGRGNLTDAQRHAIADTIVGAIAMAPAADRQDPLKLANDIKAALTATKRDIGLNNGDEIAIVSDTIALQTVGKDNPAILAKVPQDLHDDMQVAKARIIASKVNNVLQGQLFQHPDSNIVANLAGVDTLNLTTKLAAGIGTVMASDYYQTHISAHEAMLERSIEANLVINGGLPDDAAKIAAQMMADKILASQAATSVTAPAPTPAPTPVQGAGPVVASAIPARR
jgi:hypothetical protein